MKIDHLKIAMLCLHSNPVGELGTPDTGGMSVYVRELAKELGRCGHLVDIYTRTTAGLCPEVLHLSENVRIIHLAVQDCSQLPKLELYPLLPKFLSALENFRKADNIRYDFIYSHYWLSGIVGEWARELWKAPHLIMFHTLGALKNIYGLEPREPDLRVSAEKKLAEQCSGVIMASEREQINLIHHYGSPSDKTALVPCGVNFDHFHPIEKKERV